MSYDEIIERVQERAGIADRSDAEGTTIEVLQELCDRLSGKEARDLLAQLPGELQRAVIVSPSPLPIDHDAFIANIGRELGLSDEEARKRIRAVVSTLREAVSWGEFQDVLEELDPQYADFVA
ncbi:MAG TPA: DUF2267 domain-containing protein [Gaiellaceae bacterium]|jgi:uncharacterized protein (DUF2267 family)|nr:DUF2267 domain-containing protein [Gaiellaceae bacterium]